MGPLRGLQYGAGAVVLAGPVVDDVTLVDVAGTGQLCAAWTDVDVTLRVKTKSLRLKVPSERADLSHTGMCGVTSNGVYPTSWHGQSWQSVADFRCCRSIASNSSAIWRH